MASFEQSLPPLASLIAFEAAHRRRNFSHAAEELFQSQTTISRRVRELEANLGVPLFERRRHDVIPTADGDELAASVRLSLTELSSTATRIRERANHTRSLTVLTSLSLAPAAVTPIVGTFQQRHPDVTVRVVSSCEPIDATREQFDVALQYGTTTSSRFHVEFVADETVFPVCSPGFAASLPSIVSVFDFAALPLLHVDYEHAGWTTWAEFLEAAGAPSSTAERSLSFTSYALCLDVAERGDGIALGWERSVRPRIDAGHLVSVGDFSIPRAATINAYLADSARGDNHALEILDLLRTAIID